MFIDELRVIYKPPISTKASKTVRENSQSIRLSIIIPSENYEEIKKLLKRGGATKIESEPLTLALPKKCPECQKVGDPVITKDKKAGKLEQRWLKYNHTGSKPHRIGRYEIIKGKGSQKMYVIKLKKTLKPDSFKHSRIGLNSIQ